MIVPRNQMKYDSLWTMAGILDEFDDATPVSRRYCSSLTVEQYEDQSESTTEAAIADLIAHLESNPQEYRKILKSRKKEETEDAGIFSYLKVKFCSLFTGDDGCDVSEEECQQQLEQLKGNMIKSYNYSQECKGRRFSKRLVDRRARKEIEKMNTPSRGPGNIPIPPPPPPLSVPGTPKLSSVTPNPHSRLPKRPAIPPKPPNVRRPYSATPIVHLALTRRPLSSRQEKQTTNKLSSGDARQDLFRQIKGSECKKRLKRVEKSQDGKELPRQPKDSDLLPFFNTKLLSKFKNAQSPALSPTLASPGSFESPVSTPPLPQSPEPKRLKTSKPHSKASSKLGRAADLRDQENTEPMEVH